ncbi:hypothetical protein [Oceanobacillus kimchii]|uniref:Uncharacterized protein n=1 Tax=Oceanobacillus kimchii TaxID=746691 RepID=A0ABQ5TH31_9BACI|nr:hypothetical protein [Oceanobacillus kimchii]GLO66186.1 hypothetical protein MACH08_19700 [Oceanobacillus kimchii]
MDYSQERLCSLLEQNGFYFVGNGDLNSKKYSNDQESIIFFIGEKGWDAFDQKGNDYSGLNYQTTEVGNLISSYKKG